MYADEHFAARTRETRLDRSMTQSQLANRMRVLGHTNFHQVTIVKIETNQRKVGVAEALSLASVLGVDLVDLLPPVLNPIASDAETVEQVAAFVKSPIEEQLFVSNEDQASRSSNREAEDRAREERDKRARDLGDLTNG